MATLFEDSAAPMLDQLAKRVTSSSYVQIKDLPAEMKFNDLFIELQPFVKAIQRLRRTDSVTAHVLELSQGFSVVLEIHRAGCAAADAYRLYAKQTAAELLPHTPLVVTVLAIAADAEGNVSTLTLDAGVSLDNLIDQPGWHKLPMGIKLAAVQQLMASLLLAHNMFLNAPGGPWSYRDANPANIAYAMNGSKTFSYIGCDLLCNKESYFPDPTTYMPPEQAALNLQPLSNKLDRLRQAATRGAFDMCQLVHVCIDMLFTFPPQLAVANFNIHTKKGLEEYSSAILSFDWPNCAAMKYLKEIGREDVAQLFIACLSHDPAQRPTPQQAMQHPCLVGVVPKVQAAVAEAVPAYLHHHQLVLGLLGGLRGMEDVFLASQEPCCYDMPQFVAQGYDDTAGSSEEEPATPCLYSTRCSQYDADADSISDAARSSSGTCSSSSSGSSSSGTGSNSSLQFRAKQRVSSSSSNSLLSRESGGQHGTEPSVCLSPKMLQQQQQQKPPLPATCISSSSEEAPATPFCLCTPHHSQPDLIYCGSSSDGGSNDACDWLEAETVSDVHYMQLEMHHHHHQLGTGLQLPTASNGGNDAAPATPCLSEVDSPASFESSSNGSSGDSSSSGSSCHPGGACDQPEAVSDLPTVSEVHCLQPDMHHHHHQQQQQQQQQQYFDSGLLLPTASGSGGTTTSSRSSSGGSSIEEPSTPCLTTTPSTQPGLEHRSSSSGSLPGGGNISSLSEVRLQADSAALPVHWAASPEQGEVEVELPVQAMNCPQLDMQQMLLLLAAEEQVFANTAAPSRGLLQRAVHTLANIFRPGNRKGGSCSKSSSGGGSSEVTDSVPLTGSLDQGEVGAEMPMQGVGCVQLEMQQQQQEQKQPEQEPLLLRQQMAAKPVARRGLLQRAVHKLVSGFRPSNRRGPLQQPAAAAEQSSRGE